jgi:hypothetical protein
MVDVADLTLAYTRRKHFEAKLLARELAAMLSPQQTAVPHTKPKTPDRIHPDIMFSNMGVTIQ